MSIRSACIFIVFTLLILSGSVFSSDDKDSLNRIDADKIFLIVEKVISGKILGTALSEPYGLAQIRDGSIYVVDRGSNLIIKFDSLFTPEKHIGGFGAQSESFNRPTFITVDNNLNFFVTDENNRRVARFDLRLNFVDEIKFSDEDDPFKFGYPSGTAVTSYGEVWVADRERNRLCLFNNIGNFDRFLAEFGTAEGQLESPEKIVVDDKSRFYICDAGHARIIIFDEFGNFIQKLEFEKISYPISAAFAEGYMWVVDGAESIIFLADKDGKVIKQFGPMLTGDKTILKEPSDLIFLGKNKLLISDSGNGRLLVCRVEWGDSK